MILKNKLIKKNRFQNDSKKNSKELCLPHISFDVESLQNVNNTIYLISAFNESCLFRDTENFQSILSGRINSTIKKHCYFWSERLKELKETLDFHINDENGYVKENPEDMEDADFLREFLSQTTNIMEQVDAFLEKFKHLKDAQVSSPNPSNLLAFLDYCYLTMQISKVKRVFEAANRRLGFGDSMCASFSLDYFYED